MKVAIVIAVGAMLGICALTARAQTLPSDQSRMARDIEAAMQLTEPKDARQAAARFASDYGRDGVEPIVRAILSWREDQRSNGFLYGALIDIADPNGDQGFKEAAALMWDDVDSAIAAIAGPHDERACEALLQLATGSYASQSLASTSYYSCALLRSFDSRTFASRIESAIRGDDHSPQQDYLRALRESIHHADAMTDATEREAYRDFERRFWTGWALTLHPMHGMFLTYYARAKRIGATWKPGDERQLKYIFDSPLCSPDEKRVAMALVARLHLVAHRDTLKAIKAENSDNSVYAEYFLSLLDRPATTQSSP